MVQILDLKRRAGASSGTTSTAGGDMISYEKPRLVALIGSGEDALI